MSEISRARPRHVLYVFNRGSDSESSEDDRRPSSYGTSSYSPYQPPPLPALPASPPAPSPLKTNIPPQLPRAQASTQSLSSPSSASSPADPTPSTDDTSFHDRSNRTDVPHISTARGVTGKFLHGLKSPFHYKSSQPRPQPPTPSSSITTTSPTTSTPDSYTSSTSIGSSTTVSDRTLILATADSDRYVNVDITGATSADYIRECIFTKLNILDDEQSHFSIYRTEIGLYALGEALSDDKLIELCRIDGDSKGSLKLLVSHSSATVHEPPPPNSALSPSVSTVPPPVLPNYSNAASCAPLRPRRPSRSRHGSLSSSEQLNSAMEVSAGYEADLDNAERDTHRPVPVRPLPQIGSPGGPGLPSSPPNRRLNSQARASSPKPSRSSTPSPPSLSERTRAGNDGPVVQDRFGNFVPAPPPPPPLSPHRANFAINDDGTLLPPFRQHIRSGSDAAAEREQIMDPPDQRPHRVRGVENQRQDVLRDRRVRAPLPQHLDTEETADRHESSIYGSPQDPESSPSSSKQSPVRSRITRSQQPLSPVRYKNSAPYTRHINIPAPPRHPPPNAPTEQRAGPSRSQAGQPVPANFVVTWKGEEKGDQKLTPAASSGRSLKGAKSMDSLRAASIPQTLQPGRRINNGQLPISRSNLGFAPYGGGSSRPLPPKATQSASPYPVRSSPAQGTGYMSLNGPDPYPRPHSALGDAVSSPTRSRPYDSHYPSDFAGYYRSHPTLSPTLPLNPSRSNPRPSDVSSPPQSPVTPQSPRSLPRDRAMEGVLRPSVEISASSDSTLHADERGWLNAVMASSARNGDSTLIPPRLEKKTPPSSRHPPTPVSNSYDSTTADVSDSDSDRESEGGTMWQKPPQAMQVIMTERPVLTVHIDGSNGKQPVSIPSGSPQSSHPPAQSGSVKRGRGRGSTFTDARDASWAPRPPPEEMYERLEEFFPEHDLDKPVIEANSGGTSPTAGELLPPPPPTPAPPETEEHSTSEDTVVPMSAIPPQVQAQERSRMRNKKSIRVVAEEHKRRINRVSKQVPPDCSSSFSASVLRKRSTKLWGSRLEEVTPQQAKAVLSSGMRADSPTSNSDSSPTFRWVRGELIGKGSYGRVYLALNATTGEMIAVKQVEMPRTPSDKNDSRQNTVVQSLKLESETLKELDHPNIVQYLGFEETPANLSIFLEYVPGGSVGSCLLKHGKFSEDITKSFTGQILDGLEYLHSKGILHRDMKADNILVETTGVCKISDFGISKRTQDNFGGAETAMQGTVFWMAPEVVNPQGKGYNFKVDIWSVGCVVLEMWAGTRPWQGDEMVAVMFKLYQLKQPPPIPAGISLTELADDFRRKCFAINPDERPSATELRKHKYLTVTPGWTFTGFDEK